MVAEGILFGMALFVWKKGIREFARAVLAMESTLALAAIREELGVLSVDIQEGGGIAFRVQLT